MKKVWFSSYPSHVPKQLPPFNKKIIAIFRETCKEFGTNPAFISFDKKMSYLELEKWAFYLAGYLQSQGLKKGDAIILQLPNIFQYPVSFWSSVISGLTVVNMNPYYTPREMLHQIKETNAKAIILLSSCIKSLETIIKKTDLKTVIVTEFSDLLNFSKGTVNKSDTKNNQKQLISLSGYISFLSAIHLGSKQKTKIYERDFDDTLLIQYTGGTTGISKGACLSQKNILAGAKKLEIWCSHSLNKGKEKAFAVLPFFHMGGFLINSIFLFFYGATNILIMNPRQISELLDVMKKIPITTGYGINTLFKSLLKEPKFKLIDFSHLKFFFTCGMTLENSVHKQWRNITKTPIIEIYGLTEACIVACNDPKNPRKEFIGLPLPSTNIRIVNKNGKEKSLEKEGELEVKGPEVMKAYWKQIEETKNVLSSEGWLKTGDIATIDKKGFLKIKGRIKDMINVSGFKVYPTEIEDVLCLHKKVDEAVVIGVKQNNSIKEIVKAFVVKKEKNLSAEELKTYCRKYLITYKVPKIIEFTENLPKSTVGKILRKKLKSI